MAGEIGLEIDYGQHMLCHWNSGSEVMKALTASLRLLLLEKAWREKLNADGVGHVTLIFVKDCPISFMN